MATHYERLGVPPDADREAIWRAYLSAIRGALSAADPGTQLRPIEAAWEVLGDPDSRAAYDRELARGQSRDDATRARLPPPPASRGPADHPAATPDDDFEGRASAPAAHEHDTAHQHDAAPEHDAADDKAAPREHGAAPEHHADEQREAAEASAGDDAPRQRRPHAGVLEQPRRRRGARRRADPAARRRAGMAFAWLAVCVLVGTGAGLVVHRMGERPERLAEGGCVALSPDKAVVVPCDAADAEGRISAVVSAPEDCAGADGGWVELSDGRLGCVELLTGD